MSSESFLQTVARYFGEALNRPSFPLDESYFTAGGDSLGAAGVLQRIDETYGVELKFRDFLEAPTPTRLALTILKARASSSGKNLASEIAALSAEDAAHLVTHLQQAKRS